MKRFILATAVLVIIGGALAGNVEAAHGHGHSGHGHGHSGHGHFGNHRGYRTFHRGYRGWSRSWYSPYYRCSFYFDTGCNSWFYYYAPQQCYLPASQIATYPPTVNIVNNVNAPAPMPLPTNIPAPPGPATS